jgi:S1-C subfamily serine protease
MSDWSRRRLLAAGAAAVATAGCAALTDVDSGEQVDTEADRTATPPPTTVAAAGDAGYPEVYRETIGSVVTVRVYDGLSTGAGSGFVRGDGTVVTNQHVVENAEDIDLAYTEGEWTSAKVLGTDAYTDLAVLEPDERPGYAEPLSLLASDPPIGTRVLALGNPYQLEASASSGIVSGVDRSLSGPNDFPIPDAIQTDAAVNPGNSGGPLVDLNGNVVGVITAGGGENIGFAISAPLTLEVAPELTATGSYAHAYVGVRLLTVDPVVAAVNDLDLDDPRGVLVSEVVDGGPADGVLEGSPDDERARGRTIPVGGDVVLSLDGTPTPTLEQLTSHVALEVDPGDTVTMEVLRDGSRTTVDLTVGERPPA